jgi:hypothetical protein
MMKKALLAATAAIAMVAGAAAQTMDGNTGTNESDKTYWWYECSVAKVTPPDRDSDPVYKINVYLDAADYSFVKVVHTMRSGREVSRADQYTKNVDIGKNKNGASTWFGVHGKNPKLAMGGIFGVLKNGQWVYDEMQFMQGRKEPTMVMRSVCHQI